MVKFAYPPCVMNVMTEKPYTKHKWGVKLDAEGKPVLKWEIGNNDLAPFPLYHIYCERCGFNDPKKERF